MTTLAKSEYDAYRGGQNAALRLTAVLWTLAIGAVVALRFAYVSGDVAIQLPVAFVSFTLIGWCQASLSNGFHEALHWNFGERHSDRVSAILLGYPTFFTLCYRAMHLQHHLKGGDPDDDPDHRTYGSFPKSRTQMVWRFFSMGTGLSAALQVLGKVTGKTREGAVAARLRADGAAAGDGPSDSPGAKTASRRKGEVTLRAELPWLIGTQLAIAALFVGLFGFQVGALAYVLFWILPLGTVAKTVKATRSFCEHGSPDGTFVLRTITGRPWQTGTLGMYGFHYHAEHHLYPWVPYAKLAPLHDRLKGGLLEAGSTRLGKYEVFDGGYFGLLVSWFKDLPWTAPQSESVIGDAPTAR